MELINRENILRYIENLQRTETMTPDARKLLQAVWRCVAAAVDYSGEYVRVVRCRDCNYWLHGECDKVAQHMDGDTIGVGLETDGEHFCSWAERRQDGERD